MFRNYLISSLRSLDRQRTFSLISIFGLSIALGCTCLVGVFVLDELNYDAQHPRAESTYLVIRSTQLENDAASTISRTSGALAGAMREELPGVTQVLRTLRRQVGVTYNNQTFEEYLTVADEDIFDFFHLPMLQGDAASFVAEPGGVVISEKLAAKLFGEKDPMGETILVRERSLSGTYRITGILQNIPRQSTVHFGLLVIGKSVPRINPSWREWVRDGYRDVQTWARFNQIPTPATLQSLNDLFARHMGEEAAAVNRLYLQRVSDIYLYSARDFGIVYDQYRRPFGDIVKLQLAAAAGLFVLVMAGVNFVNITMAGAARRTQEIGLRLALGAERKQIGAQFLLESVLQAAIALPFGIGTAALAMPLFREVVNRDLPSVLDVVLGPLGAIMVAGTILLGLLSGIYPSIVLPRISPSQIFRMRGGGVRYRTSGRLLTVFQFSVAMVLLICALVIHSQLEFTRTQDLGFEREEIVRLPLFWDARYSADRGTRFRLHQRYWDVKDAFRRHPDVLGVCGARFRMGAMVTEMTASMPERPGESWSISEFSIDDDALGFFSIELVDGQNFARSYIAKTWSERGGMGPRLDEQFILNETAVDALGLENPVGQRLTIGQVTGRVIGVVRDFNYRTLRTPIGPFVFTSGAFHIKHLYVKVRPGRLGDVLPFLEEQWKAHLPAIAFRWTLLNEDLETSIYEQDVRLFRMIGGFSLIGMILAIVGLFALATLAAQKRQREVGIRKVLGASALGVSVKLTSEFLILVGISAAIAFPIGHVMMSGWLQDFVYAIPLDYAPFSVVAVCVLGLSAATAGIQSLRAALANPVDTLRQE